MVYIVVGYVWLGRRKEKKGKSSEAEGRFGFGALVIFFSPTHLVRDES